MTTPASSIVPPELNLRELTTAALHTVRLVLRKVHRRIKTNPEQAFKRVKLGDRDKPALRIDAFAEDLFEGTLLDYHAGIFSNITVYGEERLDDPNLDLSGAPGHFALVDAIDGTDLLERGLGNWCSAVTFFSPSADDGKRIKAAFVGLPSGEVYFATAAEDCAYVQMRAGEEPAGVKGPSNVTSIKDASICYYGQKAKNFLSLKRCPVINAKRRTPFRVYTLAGIPMMVKLIDKRVKTARGIDAVFDICGQKPHDVVPGAFIAKKAHAALRNLNGKNVDYVDLEKALMRPAHDDSNMTYIIASTDQLCNEIIPLLRVREKRPRSPSAS